MKTNSFVLLCLLSSSKAIRFIPPVSIGQKLREIELNRYTNNELIQTNDHMDGYV